jgi:hypothetical protein
VDYKKLNGSDLLHEMGQDASKWAAAFCQMHPDANVDEDLMLGWFANAIMHALDTERGTIINGEHAEYLLSRGLSPRGHKAES